MIESLLALGFVDIFDPASISTYVVVLSLVKKRWHALVYILGVYLAYVACSLGIFLGVEKILLEVVLNIVKAYPIPVGIGALSIGGGCIIGLGFALRFLVQVLKKEKSFDLNSMLNIKSIHPVFLFLFGVVCAIIAMPYSYPIVTYIGIMAANGVTFIEAIPYICAFCMTSQLPLFVIHYLSIKLDGDAFRKVLARINRFMSIIAAVAIPILLVVCAWWLITQGIALV